MSSDLTAAMRATTEGFLHDFEGQWEEGATLSYRSPECKHVMLPVSLGIPARSNDDFETYFKRVAPLVREAVMTINDFVAAPVDRRAVCRSSMTAMTDAGKFENEYVWFFTFDESGRKITHIEEFLDSHATKAIRERFSKAGLLSQSH
ncbi:hypothetical protein M409DRAFT_20481 [Zasmidium cellare ATCC 36951]|uniref:SnoaL-like domain-containing protein n=1 Tax=Zasmidium cellare ATCC 36951 TaxID=1080233 RepID=A0A6A6CSU5_ZASCE|nr:uncharacterized protein M409DRAFT_20481 [Zasmidium cellare ATCC 36951]KAF2169258.1 hypothetical protein M409DRAFT_20481 [Zasmidium cellare ATCC 36951]